MSNLAEDSKALIPKTFRVVVDGNIFAIATISSSRKIKLYSEDFSNLKLHVGQYLLNLSIEDENFNKQINSGIISHIDADKKQIEVGLFFDLTSEFFEDSESLCDVVPFKKDFKLENIRKSKRVNIRSEDAVKLKIYLSGLTFNVRLLDLSSFGFSFVSDSKFSVGVSVGFELILRGGKYSGKAEITWIQQHNGQFKTGVEYSSFENTEPLNHGSQIVIKDGYFIHGIYSKINYYFERSEFKVLSLSKTSFVLQVEKTSQYLLPGMKLDLKFFLSNTNFESTSFTTSTICFVKSGPKGSLIVGCNIDCISESLSLNLSNYLLQFLDVSPDEVRNAGFNVSKIADVFTFRYVETHSDYIEVLKLRYEAYLSAGKVDKSKRPDDMVASLDSKSRILMVKHQGLLIASVAISFPDSNDIILDTEKALPNGYTKNIPPKTLMIEISRLCTHPEYRKGDLLHRVFEHIYKIFITSDRRFIITSCDDKLWPLYAKLGFKKTGLQYNHLALSGLLHHIIIGSIDVCLKVNKISWITWSYLYGGMYMDLDAKRVIKVNYLVKSKMMLGSVFLLSLTKVLNVYANLRQTKKKS